MKTTILIILMTAMFSLAHAQNVVNSGGFIYVVNGTTMVIEGDFENQLDGNMSNNGQVSITGNWTNNATSGNLLQGTIGTVDFNGTTTQNIDGSSKTWFNDVNTQNDVNIGTETSVASILNLSGGSAFLGTADLLMESGANISGAGPSNYVVTQGSGQLVQEGESVFLLFPVGTATSYVPATLANGGPSDNYGINVFADVLDGGTTGSTIPEIDNCVNNTWFITEETVGGLFLSIFAQWNASDEGSSFDRTQSGLGIYTAGNWDPQAVTPAQGTGPYTLLRSFNTSLGAFVVGDINSPMAAELSLTIDLVAFLEGPFNGSDMSTDLNTGGLLPINQPFNTAPWYYNGTEPVLFMPPNAVDWVLLEIRDAADAVSATEATVVDRQAAFLLNDGSIIGFDGLSNPVLSGPITQNLFVVIYHRNHLSVMSANAVTKSGGVYPYNFTTGEAQAYGGANGHKEVGTGIWGMIGGDTDANGTIEAADKTAWAGQAGTTGYNSGDLNMNTQVDNVDKNDVYVGNNSSSSQVPE